MTQLGFRDFVTLKMIWEHQPTQRQLFNPKNKAGYINEFLQEQALDRAFTKPLTGVQMLMSTIDRLRGAHLITQEGSYRLTENGLRVLTNLGDNLHQWPLKANVTGANLENAEYIDLA